MRFALAESVLGRDCAAETHRVTREVQHQTLARLEFGWRPGQDVDVHVRVADVAEDDVFELCCRQLARDNTASISRLRASGTA